MEENAIIAIVIVALILIIGGYYLYTKKKVSSSTSSFSVHAGSPQFTRDVKSRIADIETNTFPSLTKEDDTYPTRQGGFILYNPKTETMLNLTGSTMVTSKADAEVYYGHNGEILQNDMGPVIFCGSTWVLRDVPSFDGNMLTVLGSSRTRELLSVGMGTPFATTNAPGPDFTMIKIEQ